jgi:hypothetical protein
MPNEAKIIFALLGGGVIGSVVAIVIILGLFNSGPVPEEVYTEVSTSYTECDRTRTFSMIDWKIKCSDGFVYDRVEGPEQTAIEEEAERREEAQRESDAKAEYEKAKAEWMAKNPPVKELFEPTRKREPGYAAAYLKENPIAGDCALVWYGDVVCTEISDEDSVVIRFPTTRD